MSPTQLCRAALAWAVLLAGSVHADTSFPWQPDLTSAQQVAGATNRLVLLHFGATWCAPCAKLEQDVYSKPNFGQTMAAHFVGVKIDVDQLPQVAQHYGVQAVPTDVVITPAGQLVARMACPASVEDYTTTYANVYAGYVSATRAAPPASQMAQGAAPVGPAAAPLQSQVAAQVASATPGAPNLAAAAPPMTPQAAAPVPQPNTATAPRDDRYAYYNQQQQQIPAAPATGPTLPSSPVTVSAGPVPAPAQQSYAPPQQGLAANQPPAIATAPVVDPQAQAPAQPAMPYPGAVAPPAMSANTGPQVAPVAVDTPQIPAGNDPLGLDGYCPVTLHERQSWQLGDTRWGMQHRGRTYLFSGPQEMERFRQNPDHYSPVMSGHDPVLALEQGKHVPGVCEYGGFYGEHVYLFSSEETYQRFCQNPDRYATQVWQAMRQPTLQR